jgi:hypothetical protein
MPAELYSARTGQKPVSTWTLPVALNPVADSAMIFVELRSTARAGRSRIHFGFYHEL